MKNMNSNRIALSFDIEDWYHIASITGSSFSLYKNLDDFLGNSQRAPYDCITGEVLRILDILKDHGIRATFFVVADVAIRYPKITEALKKSNHEIASHSLTHHSAIDSKTKEPLQSKEQWFLDQKKAKQILEDIFEREIFGFRAPNAYFANWMVPMLQELGFKYDSSVAFNSFYNKTNVRLKQIPSFPYLLNSETLGNKTSESNLMELPWSNFTLFHGLTLPAGGAFFFRLLGYRFFKMAISRALKHGDSMFYLHPLDISEKVIPEKNNSARPLLWINKGKKTEKRFIKLLNEFEGRFCPCIDVYFKNLDEPV
jgi:peptidoglycan/xylan/chitin deacetylase (PgdA/CDA1 family)